MVNPVTTCVSGSRVKLKNDHHANDTRIRWSYWNTISPGIKEAYK